MTIFDKIQELSNKTSYDLNDWNNVCEYMLEISSLISTQKKELIYKQVEMKEWEATRALELKSETEITTNAKWDEREKSKYTELQVKSIIEQEKWVLRRDIADEEYKLDTLWKYKSYLEEKIQYIRFLVKWEQNNFNN